MDNANYNFITSQVGTFNNLKSVSNNVANVNTPGYKEDKMVFEKYLTKDVKDNNTMPLDRATIVDIKQGSMKQTNRDLDFAISGDCFFMIETPLGIRYTRAGTFTINSEYQLVNPVGNRVLTENGDFITLNQDDKMIMIDAEGRIYAKNTQQDNYEERGKLAIMAIENPRALRKAGDGNFIVEGNVAVAQANPNSYKIMQGFIEESNVVPIKAMTDLVELQHKSAEAVSMTKQMENVSNNLYKVLSRAD